MNKYYAHALYHPPVEIEADNRTEALKKAKAWFRLHAAGYRRGEIFITVCEHGDDPVGSKA